MNQLTVNPTYGYQESSNSEFTFNAQRKHEFLKIARQIIEEGHEYPNVGDLCRVMDISVSTFNNHLAADEKFAKDWHELELKGEATCLSDMYSLRKKNPMYMFGWLRARFPGKYDPTKRVELSSDFDWLKRLVIDNKPQVIATEAVITSTPKPIDGPQ
jgi:hypothetical protein